MTTERRTVSVARSSVPSDSTHYGRCELDSHADTIVAGKNCVVLSYTGKECNVLPYREDYEAVNNIPIAHVATAWQCPESGELYILVFHEALWMGDTMTTSLINPNQLRHFGVNVQDDPTSRRPLSVITDDGETMYVIGMWNDLECYKWQSEDDLKKLSEDRDPFLELTCEYKIQPENQGKLVWLTGNIYTKV